MTRLHPSEGGDAPPVRRAPGPDRVGAVALAGLLAIGLTGCMTVRDKADAQQTSMMPTLDGSPENPFASKTDFTREMSPDQKFNVHVELGKVYDSQGNFEAALAEYEKAVEVGDKKGGMLSSSPLGPEQRALAERRMGGTYDRMGRFTQAEIHYRKALELAPKDAKVWNDVGYSYYLQQRLQDSENAYKTAESIDANNPKILTNLGLTLAAAGKEDEALKALSRAGGPAVGHANLGFILAAMGKTDRARTHYQNALTLQPQLNAAREALARVETTAPSDGAEAVSVAATAPAPPSPATPAPPSPTLPAVVSGIKSATAAREAKADGLTRTAAPEAPVPPPRPRSPAPLTATEPDILDNLPMLPTMLAGEPAAGPSSAKAKPLADPALSRAAATTTRAPESTAGGATRDAMVKRAVKRPSKPEKQTYRPQTNPISSKPW